MNEIAEPNRGFESNMAYPQYEFEYRDRNITISVDTWVQLQEYVLENRFGTNAEVQGHFDNILLGIVPFGMRIVKAVKED